jgi:hypothetical protein
VSRSTRKSSARTISRFLEPLETRRLLCGLPHEHKPVVEEAPHLVGQPGPEVNEPANIVWVNRGLASDNFAARFGTSAELMRRVVDAVIEAYEQMIGSFDYPSAGITYNLTVAMGASGGGFGASASLSTTFGGKPRSGSITMGAGNGSADPNDTNGWFGDPTPNDHSEFAGTIINAFSGDAQSGSPAAGLSDFYTVAAAEVAHCLGLFGNAIPGWAARTTNTGISDNASPPGFFWVFRGPSIKHLMTSNNAGVQDWGSAIHSAEGPGANITFDGDNYIGSHDIGNPFYEQGRRYMINHAFGLMFKDAYGYISENPSKWATTYSIYDETLDTVTVRGGTGTVNDTVSVTRNGNIITVSVDPEVDVAGTGSLPGNGNLPAWVTEYDLSQRPISSISINTGSGDDTIIIGSNVGVPITLNAGLGIDVLRVEGTSGADTVTVVNNGFTSGSTVLTISGNTVESFIVNGNDGLDSITITSTNTNRSVTINGGNGNDAIKLVDATGASYPSAVTVNGGGDSDTFTFDDLALAGTSSYSVTATQVSKNNGFPNLTYGTLESLVLLAETGVNAITINSTAVGTPVTVNAGGTNDTIVVNETAANGHVVVNPSTGNDIVRVNDDGVGSAEVRLDGTMRLSELSIRPGGLGILTFGGSKVLTVSDLLSITGSGRLDLTDNDFIFDYTGSSQFSAVRNLIITGRNGGLWNGAGIFSSRAASDPNQITGLGILEASTYTAANGTNVFSGQTVDATAVLVKYTYNGDTDLNGVVDFDDYARIDTAFLGSGTGFWLEGDSDYSGTIDFDDYALIDSSFLLQSGIL